MIVGNGWHRRARKHPTMYIYSRTAGSESQNELHGQAITALILRICGRVGSIQGSPDKWRLDRGADPAMMRDSRHDGADLTLRLPTASGEFKLQASSFEVSSSSLKLAPASSHRVPLSLRCLPGGTPRLGNIDNQTFSRVPRMLIRNQRKLKFHGVFRASGTVSSVRCIT